MLVVSGSSEAEVSSAAAAFADFRTPLPRLDRAVVKPLPLDLVPAVRSISAGGTYSFNKLGMHSGPAGNGTEPSAVVPFDLPPDFFAADNRKARMTLDFKHTPNLAPGSMVDLKINSSYRSPIALDKTQEGTYQGYSISFPLNLLRPGENRIVFEPQIQAAEGNGCPTRTEMTHSIDISEQSILELPPVARVAHQPDLHLFHSTGYPYTAPGEAGISEIVIPDGDDEGIAGAWTLAAKLAQMADQPLHQMRIGLAPSGESRHVILIGTLDRVAPVLKKGMGIEPDSLATPQEKADRTPVSRVDGTGVAALQETVRAWAERAWAETRDWFERLGPSAEPGANAEGQPQHRSARWSARRLRPCPYWEDSYGRGFGRRGGPVPQRTGTGQSGAVEPGGRRSYGMECRGTGRSNPSRRCVRQDSAFTRRSRRVSALSQQPSRQTSHAVDPGRDIRDSSCSPA